MTRLLMALRNTTWARRKRCHGTTICCQHVDLPTCNTRQDTHWRGRRSVRRINAS